MDPSIFQKLPDKQIILLYADMMQVADRMGFKIERSQDPSMKFDVIYEMGGELRYVSIGDITEVDYYIQPRVEARKKRLEFFSKHSDCIKSKSTSLLDPVILTWLFLWHGYTEPSF